jgi:hypothetical protein
MKDIQGWKVPMRALTGHGSSLATVSLEVLSEKAPDVSFVHAFPGFVKSKLDRPGQGALVFVLRQVFKVMSAINTVIPSEENGERLLFIMTSAKYPAGKPVEGISGLSLMDGVEVTNSTGGKPGGGVYSVDENGESYGHKMETVMITLWKHEARDIVWDDLETEWKRITGPIVALIARR